MNLAIGAGLLGMLQVIASDALDLHRRSAPRGDNRGGGKPAPGDSYGNGAESATRSRTQADRDNGTSSLSVTGPTFTSFYDGHATGPGIWKWGNALSAYQRHFGVFAGHAVDIAEVGVQSGGSLLMWRSVLGQACRMYGIDVNPQCLKFQDAQTTILVGDQGDARMWAAFFSYTATALDVLVDDGGHEPHQMLITLTEVFPKLNPGGFISIEDIHGLGYVHSFWEKAATYIAQEHHHGAVASVHVYPFLLIIHKAGLSTKLPASKLSFSGPSTTVDNLQAMWPAVQANRGGHVVLRNAGWGSFLTEQGLANFFSLFGSLHEASWSDMPPGCATTAAPECATTVKNSLLQGLISGFHVYPDHLVVEVAAVPPVISAVRRGTEWMSYA